MVPSTQPYCAFLIVLLTFATVPTVINGFGLINSQTNWKNPRPSLHSSVNSNNKYLIHAPSRTFPSKSAALKSNNSNDEEEKIEDLSKRIDDRINIEDPGLVACDLFAILVACEILGLSDVFLKDSFWSNGGFMQPVTFSSFSTIGMMVKRDSILSICWIAASIYRRGYSYSCMVDDLPMIKNVFTIFTDFCSLLIVASLALAFSSHTMVDSIEVVREVWFTIVIVGTFRFAYRRRFYQ